MNLPSAMSKEVFLATFSSVFEDSPWVAECLWANGVDATCDTPTGLHQAMTAIVGAAPHEQRFALLRAHPRLAVKQEMGEVSANEQRQAQLNQLPADRVLRFQQLNDDYFNKFGFPFIMAVRGASVEAILQQFVTRLANDDITAEAARAFAEVDKIAFFRLEDIWKTLSV